MARNNNGALPAPRTSRQAGNLGFERELWQAADALRSNMDAAEYKHVVLGLIFLKYISDAFEERYAYLERAVDDPQDEYFLRPDLPDRNKIIKQLLEDPDEYRAVNIFWVPREARWSHLKANAKQPTIGKVVDDAMLAIERDNPSLKGILPKDYAHPRLDKQRLGQLIDIVGNIGLGDKESRTKDIFGRVYEYFLDQFASAEGKKGGQFYTPRCIVRLLVEMLAPYKGRVYDPCCGSGGMFVQSVEFVGAHATGNGLPVRGTQTGNGGKAKAHVSIFGQESNHTTWRLAKMNLAIRQIENNLGKEHADSFHRDLHPDLKADYVLANPPFNDSDWRGDLLKDDKRWKYGTPPTSNANFAWVQHFIHHPPPTGLAGFVLANGSMSSNQSGEGEIRKNIIEADLVDCMVALPGQLFYSTQIPVCLWFIARDKKNGPACAGQGAAGRRFRDRPGETLFIDARKLGTMIDRVHRELTEDDIRRVADTYHAWRGDPALRDDEQYEDIPGFCKAATIEDIRKHGHILTPGRYVGAAEVEDDLPAPRPGVFFVYAIKCEGGSYYIGHTDNIPRRWQEHIYGKGADWTKKHKPIYIAHYEEFTSREEAIEREKELKTTNGRRWLKKAIAEGRARQAGGEPFEEKMARLTAALREQTEQSAKLDQIIWANLEDIGYGE